MNELKEIVNELTNEQLKSIGNNRKLNRTNLIDLVTIIAQNDQNLTDNLIKYYNKAIINRKYITSLKSNDIIPISIGYPISWTPSKNKTNKIVTYTPVKFDTLYTTANIIKNDDNKPSIRISDVNIPININNSIKNIKELIPSLNEAKLKTINEHMYYSSSVYENYYHDNHKFYWVLFIKFDVNECTDNILRRDLTISILKEFDITYPSRIISEYI